MTVPRLFVLLIAILSLNGFINKTSVENFNLDITKSDWSIWKDTLAVWKNDKLFTPPYNLDNIPTNKPTGGWQELYKRNSTTTKLPCTIEEIFSDGKKASEYHGVSWFFTTTTIPSNWNNKQILLQVEDARLRLEVYVNEKLAGYDLVDETVYITEISKYLNFGKPNKIAFRITNPGGTRGWEDYPGISCGDHILPASHDFGGIGGKVVLSAVPDVYISDIFVKNLKPFENKTVEIATSIDNHNATKGKAKIEIEITEKKTGTRVFKNNYNIILNGLKLQEEKFKLSVEKAKHWSIENPHLYNFTVKIKKDKNLHQKTVESGFRVVEARIVNNKHNIYLNGNRLRIRSAIDWGYYALTGLYATKDMAIKSVKAAKDIGHNCISFHRCIGEPIVFDYSNEMGLYTYEEPGGFHSGGQGYTIKDSTITSTLMIEKCRRMVLRDRNHPSLLFYSLSNEDSEWDTVRERAMIEMNKLDNSRFIFNCSGGNIYHDPVMIHHTRPYENEIRRDFLDNHTVTSESRFQEKDLHAKDHSINPDSTLVIFGEVRCYAGPDNAYAIIKDHKDSIRLGYDLNAFKPMHDKLERFFNEFNLAESGSKVISSPEMITKQAARGLMYIDGRLAQSIMKNNSSDGYAINGWSGGSSLCEKDNSNWASALLDEGRNLKGPAEDYAYWVRDLQIAIFRKNGKYFKPGDSIKFDIHLINENKIPKGDYVLKLKLKDGSGNYTNFEKQINVAVESGDTHAQLISEDFTLIADNSWQAGYITLEGKLYKNEQLITDGVEQVLLQNRIQYKQQLASKKIHVHNWKAAEQALLDSETKTTNLEDARIILAGDYTDYKTLSDILYAVKEKGTKLIVKYNKDWADAFVKHSLLKSAPTQWGGFQKPYWNGNGWGYLDGLIGNQAIPSKTIISTNGWEVPSDPYGFWPYNSDYKIEILGAFIARLDEMLILSGEISYGKGKILLLPSYQIDEHNAFNDLIFFSSL